MSEFIYPKVSEIQQATNHLLDSTSKLFDCNQDAFASKSILADEIERSTRPESIVSANAVSQVLIEYGADHLSAFAKLLNNPIETNTCWTCIRSMLEACAIAQWLSDPAIDSNLRIARTFAYRYEGLEQQLKYVRAMNWPDSELQRIEDRLNSIEADANSIGMETITDKKGKRVGLAVRLPGATEMIQSQLNEESAYRLMSAVAHGHHWAISQIGYEDVPGDESVDLGGVPAIARQKMVFHGGIVYLMLVALRAFARPVLSNFEFRGWDKHPFETILEETYDILQLPESARFWRSA